METIEVPTMRTNAQTCIIMKLNAEALPPVAPVTDHFVSTLSRALKNALM